MNDLAKLTYLDKAYYTTYYSQERIAHSPNDYTEFKALWHNHLTYYIGLVNPETLYYFIYSKLTIL